MRTDLHGRMSWEAALVGGVEKAVPAGNRPVVTEESLRNEGSGDGDGEAAPRPAWWGDGLKVDGTD